jgi:hypothetical protein
MCGDEIKVSARMVVELLAGILDPKEIARNSSSLRSEQQITFQTFSFTS